MGQGRYTLRLISDPVYPLQNDDNIAEVKEIRERHAYDICRERALRPTRHISYYETSWGRSQHDIRRKVLGLLQRLAPLVFSNFRTVQYLIVYLCIHYYQIYGE